MTSTEQGGRLTRRRFFGHTALAPFGVTADSPTTEHRRGWIILAVDWEYNDEFSYPTDGTHPRPRVYLAQEEAAAECERLCGEFFSQSPQEFEADFESYDCDPETATWEELRAAGFPDPYFVEEMHL